MAGVVIPRYSTESPQPEEGEREEEA
jgi:hypothetical protein